MQLFAVIALGLSGSTAALAAVDTEACKAGRRLVWSDEFDGTELDRAKWQLSKQGAGASDCLYTNDARAVAVKDGKLHLRVSRTGDAAKPYLLPCGIDTHTTMAFRYGYLEMRARVPFRHGAWPSFWLQSTWRYRKCAWMSEVDIFEVFSSSNKVSSNLHKWGKEHVMLPGGELSDGKGFKHDYVFANCAGLSEEYHVYGFEWTPKAMSFYVDGEKYTTYPIDGSVDYGTWVPEVKGMAGHHDFHSILLWNEMFTPGHGWCPKEMAVTQDDRLPYDYDIDWMRLYQKDGEELKVSER